MMACLLVAALQTETASSASRADELTLSLAIGQRDTIEMENPSIECLWAIDARLSSNLAILRIDDMGCSQNANSKKFLNGHGYHRWTIEAVRSGKATIVFVDPRPSESTPNRTHQIVVEVAAR
jgi:predicted secreted protein